MTSQMTKDPRAPIDPAIERQVEEIMKRPYRKVISGDAEEGFLIEVPDLPGCMTAGETEEEAVELLRDAMAGWLTVSLERGLPIPEPASEPGDRYSGYISVRMPKSLHRRLAEQARAEGVSLNQWAITLLARGIG
jgi:antitoxin HicB